MRVQEWAWQYRERTEAPQADREGQTLIPICFWKALQLSKQQQKASPFQKHMILPRPSSHLPILT